MTFLRFACQLANFQKQIRATISVFIFEHVLLLGFKSLKHKSYSSLSEFQFGHLTRFIWLIMEQVMTARKYLVDQLKYIPKNIQSMGQLTPTILALVYECVSLLKSIIWKYEIIPHLISYSLIFSMSKMVKYRAWYLSSNFISN